MTIDFLFGRFFVRVMVSKETINLLPSNLDKYIITDEQERKSVLLNVKKDFTLCSKKQADGWNLLACSSDFRKVAYFIDNRAAFALAYEVFTKDVSIFVDSLLNKSILLGLQFGLLVALHKECVGLHGVTLLCNDQIIILSAPSGTGKTTLAHLLETYCDAIVINGDFALLSVSDGDVIFEPTPFCGSSQRCLNHRFRVDRIVFLEQSKDNYWNDLDGRLALIQCLDNAFLPEWDTNLLQDIENNVCRLISSVKVSLFSFAPTQEAATLFCNNIPHK